jgi:hypothetical protein
MMGDGCGNKCSLLSTNPSLAMKAESIVYGTQVTMQWFNQTGHLVRSIMSSANEVTMQRKTFTHTCMILQYKSPSDLGCGNDESWTFNITTLVTPVSR